jgi:hypothetical protein
VTRFVRWMVVLVLAVLAVVAVVAGTGDGPNTPLEQKAEGNPAEKGDLGVVDNLITAAATLLGVQKTSLRGSC